MFMNFLLKPLLLFCSFSVALVYANTPTVTFSTLLEGTSGTNQMARALAYDEYGNFYVAGGTTAANFPTTAGAYQTTFNPGTKIASYPNPRAGFTDAFVMKFSPHGDLIWATYLGGPDYDRAYAIAVDSQGCVYVAGRAGCNFPTTAGVIQETFAGDLNSTYNNNYGYQDGFVAKLSADGATLLWATYVGCPGRGFIRDIKLDEANGIVHAALSTVSPNFALITGNAAQPNHGGTTRFDNAYVKMTSDGQTLLYGTYLGGNGDEYGRSIALDHVGGAYIAFLTESPNLPMVAGAYDTTMDGNNDIALYHYTSAGVLDHSTFVGGSGHEELETHQLILDSNGFVFFDGETNSSDFPTTTGAFQESFGGSSDGFVAKMSPDLSQLLAATYYGGSQNERIEGTALAPNGTSIYCTGTTASSGLPTTSDAFQSNFAGVKDGLILRFSNDLTTLEYGTYYGGTKDDQVRCISVSNRGDIFFSGQTRSSNFPIINAIDGTRNSKQAAVVGRMRVSSNELADPVAGDAVTVDQDVLATLAGSVTDDGQLSNVDTLWEQIFGPEMAFDDASSLSSEVVFYSVGNYTLQLKATDDGGAFYSNDLITVTVSPRTVPALTNFDDFRAANFTVAEQADDAISGPNADPEHDLHTNEREYALGLDPLGSDGAYWTLFTTDNYLEFVYKVRSNASDLNYQWMRSTNLSDWIPATPTFSAIVSDQGEYVTMRTKLSIKQSDGIFNRLNYNLQ